MEVSKFEFCSSSNGDSAKHEAMVSGNLTIWREAFGLGNLSSSVRKELTKCAPFLLGTDHAQYSKDFFVDVGDLHDDGIPFRKLKEDHGLPMEELALIYPLNKKKNRHPMNLIPDYATARAALHMHQRVYGGTGPDNGDFCTAFLRGMELHFQGGQLVNWAEGAVDLATQRQKNPGKNPQKLTPPCIREQIQAMIDLFDDLLSQLSDTHNAAIGQLRECRIKIKDEAQIARMTNVNVVAPLQVSWPAKASPTVSTHINVPIQVASISRQSRSTHSALSDQKALTLLSRRLRDFELQHATVVTELDAAEAQLAHAAERKDQLKKDEEGHWDELSAALKQVKMGSSLPIGEMEIAEANVRVVTSKGHEVSNALDANAMLLTKWTFDVCVLRQQSQKLEDEIAQMKQQQDVLIIEESYIRPQQFFTSFPTMPQDMVPLKERLPCALCGRFFVEMAFVPLPCGCLFHPCCIFKVVLGRDPMCPSCNHVPGGVWMGQWGFATNTTSMQASISAYHATVNDYSTWASPLCPDYAFIKIQELCQQILAEGPSEFGIKKRHSSIEVSQLEGAATPKRTRASDTKPMTPPTIEEAMSEVRLTLLSIFEDYPSIDDSAVDSNPMVKQSQILATPQLAPPPSKPHFHVDFQNDKALILDILQIADAAAGEVNSLQNRASI